MKPAIKGKARSAFGPNGEAVRELLDALPHFHWLRPEGDEASDEIISQLVAEHVDALNYYGMPPILIESDLNKALYAALYAVRSGYGAWDAVWDAAWSAAWSVAWDGAWSAAWAAIRTDWSEARAAFPSAAARDAARDAARAAGHLASGLGKANPWQPLLELWARGTWPVGYLKDGSFMVYRPAVAQ